MSAVAKTGIDVAGGVIQTGGGSGFKIHGSVVAVVGDKVTDHSPSAPGPQTTPITSHTNNQPKMRSGSTSFRVNGIPVCRNGDPSTCGHLVISTGDFSAS